MLLQEVIMSLIKPKIFVMLDMICGKEYKACSLLSSGLLCSVRWFDTDVSGPHIDSILKGQAFQEGLFDFILTAAEA
jgi:hypothetical protein